MDIPWIYNEEAQSSITKPWFWFIYLITSLKKMAWTPVTNIMGFFWRWKSLFLNFATDILIALKVSKYLVAENSDRYQFRTLQCICHENMNLSVKWNYGPYLEFNFHKWMIRLLRQALSSTIFWSYFLKKLITKKHGRPHCQLVAHFKCDAHLSN